MNLLMSEHSHDEHGHEELMHTTDVHEHSGGLDGLLEVMFGFEHVVAEFFWNAVFILATFAFTKALAFRKVHKYIDSKHGVTHEKGDY
jgi:hypothetical protein